MTTSAAPSIARRRRRALVVAVVSSPLAWPVAAQRPGPKRVGVLAPSTRSREQRTLEPFFAEMRRLGWVEGRDVVYDWAVADDQEQVLPRRAAELVARRPDLIYAPPAPAAVAAKRATNVIPIVFATGTDPVGTGLVETLRRPGGNVTGMISVVDSLVPKLVQMLREIAPAVRVIGYLGNPEDPRWKIDGDALDPIGATMDVRCIKKPISDPARLEAAVEGLVREGAQAIITGSSITFNLRESLMQLARRHAIPVAAHRAEMTDAGALFSYGASLPEQLRLSARLVDRVLKGQKPAEIPVEQPTTFELVVNRRTAKQLGLTIPASLLLRADRVVG